VNKRGVRSKVRRNKSILSHRLQIPYKIPPWRREGRVHFLVMGSKPATSVTAPTMSPAMTPPAATDFNRASTVGVKVVAIAN